jgi:hypothetical protein
VDLAAVVELNPARVARVRLRVPIGIEREDPGMGVLPPLGQALLLES